MEFLVNGKKKAFTGDTEMSLLRYLREVEGITSAKDGCSGQGACGCCTVQLEDKAVLSCRTTMKQVTGKSVTTTEGLRKEVQDAFAAAFVEKGGVQCGFCTPGIVMRAKPFLDKTSAPTREQVAKAIAGNLCRCTGYKKVIDSILIAAESIRTGKPVVVSASSGKVGSRQPKYQARETVLGLRPFVADMKAPGMLHGALRFSDHPRAKVLKIDVTRAVTVPGVARVVTARDVPGQRVIGLIIQDWPLMVAEGEITRYVGDVICGVVADTEAAARQAAGLVHVEYEVLKPVCSPEEGMLSSAPAIHKGGNVLAVTDIKFGDAERALRSSAFTTKGKYSTQRIEHAFMEMECCLAKPWARDGKPGVELFSQGQGAYEDRKQVAQILGLPMEQVRVVQIQNGGAFGGKEDLSVQGHAALMAWLCRKPVRVALTRDNRC